MRLKRVSAARKDDAEAAVVVSSRKRRSDLYMDSDVGCTSFNSEVTEPFVVYATQRCVFCLCRVHLWLTLCSV